MKNSFDLSQTEDSHQKSQAGLLKNLLFCLIDSGSKHFPAPIPGNDRG